MSFPGEGRMADPESLEDRLERLSGINMKNEMRVAYLTASFEKLNEAHANLIKANHNKHEARMKAYAINCVNEAYEELKSEWRALFLQLENLQEHEDGHLKRIETLEREVQRLERCLVEVRAWAAGDVAQHELYTQRLMEDGISPDEFMSVHEDFEYFGMPANDKMEWLQKMLV